MLILFIISSLPSSTLYGYVLSQLLSLLTRSCVIKLWNTIPVHINTGCVWLSDAERCWFDGDCQFKLNWLALSATLIILQVRSSASSRRSQEWISPRLLALVANCVNALNAYLHRRITLPLESQSWRAKARAICYYAAVGRSRIKHVTQKVKDVGNCWLFHQLYPV